MSAREKRNPEIVWLVQILLALAVVGCRSGDRRYDSQLSRFEFSKPQMGAPFRMVLYARDQAHAREAAQAAFRRVEALNEILSDYETDSDLNQLSRSSASGRAMPVSDDLWTVLVRAQRLAKLSDGTFDITVGPCVNLWRKARREQKFPEAARLAEARKAVGHEKLVLDRRTARLLVPDMKLDLGGIAKGYAVDEAMKILKQRGIRHALVAAAGDILVSAAPPDKAGWQIEAGSSPKVLSLAKAAVSTSGDQFQHVELDGVRYSHIVDPRTGIGLTNQLQVTVVARDSTTADALATAISVLGREKGLRLIKQFPGASVLWGDPKTNVGDDVRSL
jgi:FAD:protein FMN transferase